MRWWTWATGSAETIILQAEEEKAFLIGLSALLVSTSKQMPLIVNEMARRKQTIHPGGRGSIKPVWLAYSADRVAKGVSPASCIRTHLKG